jgi:hypothetical protein
MNRNEARLLSKKFQKIKGSVCDGDYCNLSEYPADLIEYILDRLDEIEARIGGTRAAI